MEKIVLAVIAIGIIALAGGMVFFAVQNQPPQQEIVGEVHYHAGFKAYIEGKAIDFGQEKFMSTEKKALSNFVHLHDEEGGVIHTHISGVTLGEFLSTLGMKLTENCLELGAGEKYCSQGEKRLRLFVNGKENTQFGGYEIKDLDKMLLTFGAETQEEINSQLNTITGNACIYSGKCPEKGSPPPEASCVSGEGCLPEGY